jgi:hypothetical protein
MGFCGSSENSWTLCLLWVYADYPWDHFHPDWQLLANKVKKAESATSH